MFWILSVIWTVLFIGVEAWPHIFSNEALPKTFNTCSFRANGSDGRQYCLDNNQVVPFANKEVSLTPIKNAGLPLLPIYGIGLALIYAVSGVQVIKEWNRRPVLRLGRYVRTAGPGMVWIDPVLHKVLSDWHVRDWVEETQVEGIQTHDNVPVSFNVITTMRMADEAAIRTAVTKVSHFSSAVDERTLTAATELVGNAMLDDILHDKPKLDEALRQSLMLKVKAWGVTIIATELKDVKIADEGIATAIAMKAKAQKEAEAELTRANMQGQIAEKLKEAAAVYDEHTWRLKGLEVLMEMTRTADNNTVLVPTGLIESLANFKTK